MPNLKNQAQFAQLKAAIAASKAIILTNYAGLSVAQQTALSQALAQVGGKFSVAKNTLIKLSLKESVTDFPQAADTALQGQTAVIFTGNDPVSPTKVLVKFAKDNDMPEIKVGFMDGQLLTTQDIENLSKLPGREQLLGMLAAQLNAPVSSFAQVLRANLQRIVFAVDAIKRSKATAS